jgi:hypothetical protein
MNFWYNMYVNSYYQHSLTIKLQGQRPLALEQFQRCRETLRREVVSTDPGWPGAHPLARDRGRQPGFLAGGHDPAPPHSWCSGVYLAGSAGGDRRVREGERIRPRRDGPPRTGVMTILVQRLPACGGGFTQRRLRSLLALVLECAVQSGRPISSPPQIPHLLLRKPHPFSLVA